jgi:hypothetical protein
MIFRPVRLAGRRRGLALILGLLSAPPAVTAQTAPPLLRDPVVARLAELHRVVGVVQPLTVGR